LLESEYQRYLIKKLKRKYTGCLILKNDPTYLQGILDLVIFFGDRWAFLEVKADETSPFRPNQEYYLAKLDEMSFASVIYPSIEREVLSALEQTLRPRRNARAVRRQ
jgi:hypothetical protein